MAPSFVGLDVALRALRAQQRALEVTSYNIANANTEGYSRRQISIVPTSPASISTSQGTSQVGTGADAEVRRLRDALVDLQMREQTTALGLWETLRDALQQIEAIFGEPGEAGFSNLMAIFFNGWDELNNDPGSTAARAAVREHGTTLAETFNWIYKQLQTIQQNMDKQIRMAVQEINDLADQIASLNGQVVRAAATGGDTGDLRDQRDRLLDKLSSLVNISYTEDSYGSVTVSLGGRNFVSRTNTTLLVATPNPSNENMVAVDWVDGLSSVNVTDGKLKGTLDLRDTTLPGMMSDLNTVAAALITNVNSVHSAGFGLNGATGLPFFTGSGANDIAVSQDISSDLANIAAASSTDSPGDGSNARAIANLRSALLMNSGTATISDYYLSMVVQLGVEVRRSENQVESQALIAERLSRRREAVSGVSLDEEAINLIRYQRAYEAAARVVTTIDEMMDIIINSMGIVGR